MFVCQQNVILQGCQDLNSAQSLFPSDFHSNLRDLLAKIIVENQASWRKLAVENQGMDNDKVLFRFLFWQIRS